MPRIKGRLFDYLVILCLVVFFASHMFSSFSEGEQGEEGWGLGVSFSRTTVAFSLHSGVPIWRSSRLFALTQQQTIIVRLPNLTLQKCLPPFDCGLTYF